MIFKHYPPQRQRTGVVEVTMIIRTRDFNPVQECEGV
jgi:hypothetical protein